jgi:hypothetical protein
MRNILHVPTLLLAVLGFTDLGSVACVTSRDYAPPVGSSAKTEER